LHVRAMQLLFSALQLATHTGIARTTLPPC
jgi:hypothetical protein